MEPRNPQKLKPCSACGRAIARTADNCPGCGAPNNEALYGKLIANFLASLFFIGLIWFVAIPYFTRSMLGGFLGHH
jgi:hypothetical protein